MAGAGSYFLVNLLILFVEMKWSNALRYIFLLRTLKVLSRGGLAEFVLYMCELSFWDLRARAGAGRSKHSY